MTKDVPRKLIAAHMLCKYPYITIEDAYFTGILAKSAGISRVHIGEAYLYESDYFDDLPYLCAQRRTAFIYHCLNSDNPRMSHYLSSFVETIASVIC
jgi:hypothetical protein